MKYASFWLEQSEYTCSFSRHDCHEWKKYDQVLIKILLQVVGILYVHWQRTRQDHHVHAFFHKITAIHSEPHSTITDSHLGIFTFSDQFQQNSYAYLLTASSQSSLSKTNKNWEPITSQKYCDWMIACHSCQCLGNFLLQQKQQRGQVINFAPLLFYLLQKKENLRRAMSALTQLWRFCSNSLMKTLWMSLCNFFFSTKDFCLFSYVVSKQSHRSRVYMRTHKVSDKKRNANVW